MWPESAKCRQDANDPNLKFISDCIGLSRGCYPSLNVVARLCTELNNGERLLLRQYVDQVPKERTQRLNAALDAMGDGLDQVQLDQMTAAMTEEYIEAWDESVWTQ